MRLRNFHSCFPYFSRMSALPSIENTIPVNPDSTKLWRILQGLVWFIGAGILYCLFFYPATGVMLFWNILIPVAPFLFVIALGFWRNVCPLATTNLLPRHLGFSRKRKMSAAMSGLLNLLAVMALFIIVPLRHVLFNNNGVATGIMVVCMAAIGVGLGFVYEWKSAWCSGLCPVQPVEKLYGEKVITTFRNAHCDHCQHCVIPCPDSTPHFYPGIAKPTLFHSVSSFLITGGLPGFIWGWFHVPDQHELHGFTNIVDFYTYPVLGLLSTLLLFALLKFILPRNQHKLLIAFFAASGVSCYYWYRIPSLIGFGPFTGDGRLIDLSHSLPEWVVSMMILMSTLFFFYWLVLRNQPKKSWLSRPVQK